MQENRILLTPDRTCHHAPRSVEFLTIKLLAPWTSLSSVYPRSFHSFVPSNFGGPIAVGTAYQMSFALDGAIPTKHARASNTIVASETNTPRSNARRPPRNGRSRRRPEHPPESNTRFCLNHVSMTFLCPKLLYVAYVWMDVAALKLIFLVGQKRQRRDGGGEMVLIAVGAIRR